MTHSSQYFAVHLQLLIVEGLTCDGGRSWMGKLFRTKIFQFLVKSIKSCYILSVLALAKINLVEVVREDNLSLMSIRVRGCSYITLLLLYIT